MGDEYVEMNINPAGEDSISNAIAKAFGKLTDRDPFDLDFILYDYIDADALDALFQSDMPAPITLEFHIEDWFVAIHRGNSTRITIKVEPDD